MRSLLHFHLLGPEVLPNPPYGCSPTRSTLIRRLPGLRQLDGCHVDARDKEEASESSSTLTSQVGAPARVKQGKRALRLPF